MHPEIDIGIESSDREAIAGTLSRVLADTYTLYLKTHNYHWNVTGPRFRDLHLLFEEQYTELATAVDEIAERIRALGVPAPGTYAEFAELSTIVERRGPLSAEAMLEDLVGSQQALIRTLRDALRTAQQGADESSTALLSDRLRVHEKAAWMLRSLL